MLMQTVETNAGTAISWAASRMACSQVFAHGNVALHVLDFHRCVVDQDADGERQSAERHDVDGLAQRAEQKKRGQDGKWNRNANDQRAPPTPRKTRIMIDVSRAAMRPSRPTPVRDALTKTDWSASGRITNWGGRVAAIPGSAARMPETMASVEAVPDFLHRQQSAALPILADNILSERRSRRARGQRHERRSCRR